MSANQRGALIFLGIIIFTAFFCVYLPFSWMPNNGVAMALPVIQVPGEVYVEGSPSADFEFVNTLAGTLLADVVVLLIALWALRKSKGWANEVPGRFQGLIEGLVGFIYGLVKQMAGTRPRVRSTLFPLVASIFFFLLVANWLELVPGVDSIGILHCAGHHGEQNGYPRDELGSFLGLPSYQLRNDQPLFAGYSANEADYHTCEAVLHGDHGDEAANTEHADDEHTELTADVIAAAAAEGKILNTSVNAHVVEAGDTYESIAEEYEGVDVETLVRLNGFEESADLSEVVPVNADGEQIVYLEEPILLGHYATNPNYQLFIVTPYVRAAATDLNLTIGLALISFFAIQYFGFASLGFGYLQKFINIKALGNLRKRPLGAVDFLVGLFEIISELSKVISLAFRLFGNIFAGQLLLFIMAFLVATLLPVIFYGLELIVGIIQALVFAVLTLVFSAQAMEGHHGDEEHEHH